MYNSVLYIFKIKDVHTISGWSGADAINISGLLV